MVKRHRTWKWFYGDVNSALGADTGRYGAGFPGWFDIFQIFKIQINEKGEHLC